MLDVMSDPATTARPVGIVVKTIRRVAVAVTIAIGVALLLLILWKGSTAALFVRAGLLALSATTVFSLFEVWPRRLPRGVERWILQVVAVGAAMPLTVFVMHRQATSPGAPPFFEDHNWMLVGFAAVLIAPWTAVATVVRQKDTFARHQTLAFALERSELERQALDARLHLLQAQVAPHFLFNTLANVQALVDAGSPRASTVLRSLTAYLRAAVPLLREPAATIDRELQLVRPYLELMQMRMPDRLQYAIDVDPSVLSVRCPPTTLLTLVENAVRHGIDPSEEGGRIDIDITRHDERCVVRVSDTGAGLRQSANVLGTGLTTLRERLQLLFGEAAHLRLTPNAQQGAIVEIDMPAHV
jgi:signal transduction histidine kinase